MITSLDIILDKQRVGVAKDKRRLQSATPHSKTGRLLATNACSNRNNISPRQTFPLPIFITRYWIPLQQQLCLKKGQIQINSPATIWLRIRWESLT
jgi:hypothetical protein